MGYLYSICFLWSNCVTDCYQIVLSSTVPEARCHDYPRCHLLVPSSMHILYVCFLYNWIIISWSLLEHISISPHKREWYTYSTNALNCCTWDANKVFFTQWGVKVGILSHADLCYQTFSFVCKLISIILIKYLFLNIFTFYFPIIIFKMTFCPYLFITSILKYADILK